MFLAALLLPELLPKYPIKLPLLLAIYVVLFLLYTDTAYRRIFWILVSVFIMAASELVAAPLAALITNTSFSELTQVKSAYCIAMIISRTIWFVILFYFTRPKYSSKKMFDD